MLNLNIDIYYQILFKTIFANSKKLSFYRVEIDIKWWFEWPLKNQGFDETKTKKTINSLWLVYNLPILYTKSQLTNME